MFKCFTLFLLCIINCSNSFAEPAPFGLEINRSTYEEVKEKYHGSYDGINEYSRGKMYNIDFRQISIDGIKSMLAIFHQDTRLLALVVKFDKNKYDSIVDSLSKKYKLISKQGALVGDKSARFQSDNTIIEVRAPHMSFHLLITYIDKDFERLYLDKAQKNTEEAQKNQSDAL